MENHYHEVLVAHRGDQESAVENTLLAFQYAYDAGAIYAECDIQFTQDLKPVVIHDDSLVRLCGSHQSVSCLTLKDLKQICHPSFELLTWVNLLQWLEDKPRLTMFVEIKPDVLSRLADKQIASLLLAFIPAQQQSQVIWISESSAILRACADLGGFKLGWVAEGDDKPDKELIGQLDYVFMSFEEIKYIAGWKHQGVRVGVYTVNTSELVLQLLDHGADLIETNCFSKISREASSL